MATLVSPGVSISLIDQTINIGAGPGTVPLVFVATQSNKVDPTGQNVIAPGTIPANAGKVWSITSQSELVSTFGDPTFYSVSGTSINGYPLNEYGLLATYSYLGLSNLAIVVRADIDLAQLEATPVTPSSPAAAGTLWLNEGALPAGSAYGLFVQAGTFPNAIWTTVTPKFIYNFATGVANTPTASDGVIGNYAVVFQTASGQLSYWVKTGTSTWNQIGSTAYTSAATSATSASTVVTVPSTLNLQPGMVPVVSGGTGVFAANTVVTAVTSSTTFTVNIAPTTALVAATVTASFGVTIQSVWPDLTNPATTQEFWIKTTSAAQGANLVLDEMSATTSTFVQVEAPILANDAAADVYYSTEPAGSNGRVYIEPVISGVGASSVNSFEFRIGTAPTNSWFPLETIIGSTTAPVQGPTNGQLWFNGLLGLNSKGQSTVDIMVADNEGAWQNINLPGFSTLTVLPGAITLYPQSGDPRANIPAPTLINGDIWVQTDVQPYPTIYRWNGSKWVLVNNTDQTTPNGIIFDDARPNPLYHNGSYSGENNEGGSNPDLDPDAPQAALYPPGFLLWNTRYSTNDVKVWESPYVFNGVTAQPDDTNNGSTGRWSNDSGNNADGLPYMGAGAQQQVIVKAMLSSMITNQNILAEDLFFNLIAAPGFVECIPGMITINTTRDNTAFVVGDSPFTLPATGTALQNWATNSKLALTDNNDGLVSVNSYLGVWYPSGLTSNTDGTSVVVPPSHMALSTIAYNDQVAYPWFAPAGLQRGVVNNATDVGYVNAQGQFISTQLNQGQRDILYQNGVNPIRIMPSGGLVIFGQKDRQAFSSALDRINVARLINYLNYQFNQLAMPFLFEPNDTTTRNAVLAAFNSFLSELITLRGLYDFLVVCDTSNNTPARIEANQLWIDVAIQPEIAIEFIYIPIRLVNTGSSLTAGA